MNITDRASVRATRVIHIEAGAGRVWTVLLDIDRWPAWNHAVSYARLETPAVPGTVFRWKSGGYSIVSSLQKVDAPHHAGWTGRFRYGRD